MGAITGTAKSRKILLKEVLEPAIEAAARLKTRMSRAAEQGYGDTLYHGSTHDIERMGGATASPESHFGASNYLTTSADDASRHYAGEGPDD